MKYYNNNLVFAYKMFILGSTIVMAIGGMITLYIVASNYGKYDREMKKTYVYSTNGASIEVQNSNSNPDQ